MQEVKSRGCMQLWKQQGCSPAPAVLPLDFDVNMEFQRNNLVIFLSYLFGGFVLQVL
jgi:hypothetical protein